MTQKSSNRPDTPEKYIRTRARSLPLGECYITSGWQRTGMAFILVTRRHSNGNITLASFQVDLYCLGIKDAFWLFNQPPEVLSDIKKKLAEQSEGSQELISAEYVLAHNIVYGALAFAEEMGFSPHKDFDLAQYILEADDEHVEFMDIEFGLDGYPAVMVGKEDHPAGIFRTLDANVGKGNYFVMNGEGEVLERPEDRDQEEEDDEKDISGAPGGSSVKPMTRDMIDLTNERLMKYLNEQNFESFEQAQDFMAKNITGKRIDDVIPNKKGRPANKDRADDLMYLAYGVDEMEGIRLARQALEIDPESVRAYNFLAEHEPDVIKAAALLEKAVGLGEKQLGETFFRENKGHFWGLPETRPYMTAKFGLARCYEEMGKENEAIKIFEELIRLNPNDNQGVRYELSRVYLKHTKYDRFNKLFKKFKSDSTASWLYNYAYYLFKIQGAGETADDALLKAYESNKHVIRMIMGKEKPLKKLGDHYQLGHPDEATYYLINHMEMWMNDFEAMRWVLRFSHNV